MRMCMTSILLKPSGSVVDNLILCDLQSVWDVHGINHDDHDHEHEGHEHAHDDHDHDHADHQHEEHAHNTAATTEVHKHEDHDHEGHDHDAHEHEHAAVSPADAKQAASSEQTDSIVSERPRDNVFVKSIADDVIQDHSLEITALLVKYSSPAAIGVVPKMINQSTSMQAASPALETARLFSLLGVGIDSLEILAYVIMIIAGLSVFISLYNALKDREYDLAIMRALGASKVKLFALLLVEGLVITTIGGLLGLLFGHLGLYFISTQTSQSADIIQAFSIYSKEWLILLTACLIGVIASVIPAIKAYNTTISTILGNK